MYVIFFMLKESSPGEIGLDLGVTNRVGIKYLLSVFKKECRFLGHKQTDRCPFKTKQVFLYDRFIAGTFCLRLHCYRGTAVAKSVYF